MIRIEIEERDIGCLNNAIRREIEAVERRQRADGSLEVEWAEYHRQLYACRDAVAKAFEAAG